VRIRQVLEDLRIIHGGVAIGDLAMPPALQRASISRSIIETDGGRLWAETSKPRGAVFRFTLPIGDDPAPSLSQSSP
jgi:hypothetical protein